VSELSPAAPRAVFDAANERRLELLRQGRKRALTDDEAEELSVLRDWVREEVKRLSPPRAVDTGKLLVELKLKWGDAPTDDYDSLNPQPEDVF